MRQLWRSIRRKLWRYGPGLVLAFFITGLVSPRRGEFVETFVREVAIFTLLVGWGIVVRRAETKEELKEVLLDGDIQRLGVFKEIRRTDGTADNEEWQKFEKERKELEKKVKQDRLDVWAWAKEHLGGGVLTLGAASNLANLLRWVQEQLDWPPWKRD